MTDIHKGSCQCGAVRYEVEGDLTAFFLCHCKRCRKATGSAHASNIFSETATLRWLSGEDQLRSYNVPDTRHVKTFCTTCGSSLPHLAPSGRLKVPAGSLDTDAPIRPQAHIFRRFRANWDDHLEDVPLFDERPG